MKRKFYAVGNWKMYKTVREAVSYLEELLPLIEGCEANLFLAVPFTSIASLALEAKQTPVAIGAQNLHEEKEGPFTGEISALMLKEAGAVFVLIGHSERRTLFGETEERIHRKVIRALQDDLQPILCVGESLQEREEGRTEEALKRQITSALQGVPKEEGAQLILAYEPVWAIGTGKTATAEIVQEVHLFCRSLLVHLWGKKVGGSISILYGGSVTPDNVAHLIAQEDVDGVLVGGASLDCLKFAKIGGKLNSRP